MTGYSTDEAADRLGIDLNDSDGDPDPNRETGEDINDRVVREWISDTSPGERVWSIMKRTYEPQTVEQIADRSRVSPIRAEHLLHELVEDDAVTMVCADGETQYHRSPESIISERKALAEEARRR